MREPFKLVLNTARVRYFQAWDDLLILELSQTVMHRSGDDDPDGRGYQDLCEGKFAVVVI